ncbi:MAG TPA: hypothetical protein VFF52_10775 [Isosphaeraceae bacterium]|nr:hypothetical protein [Isosphaeraceae bacterium]
MPIVLASLIVFAVASGTAPLEHLGRFDARAIPEASGIVKSRRFPGIFWVHNDSGNPPLLFAVRSDGRIVRQFRLAVPNLDWEDITIDDQGHLYLGDIGNNGGLLRVRVIYRIDEPDPSSTADQPLAASAAITYALPRSNRFDAEGLVYDRGTAIVVAKSHDGREAELFAVPLDPPAPPARPAQPRAIGRLPGFTQPATGAALSADRSLLAVCSDRVTRIYRRGASPPWRLVAEVRYQPLPIEGIAWDGPDLILAAEEGRGLYRLSQATWRAATPRAAATSKAR